MPAIITPNETATKINLKPAYWPIHGRDIPQDETIIVGGEEMVFSYEPHATLKYDRSMAEMDGQEATDYYNNYPFNDVGVSITTVDGGIPVARGTLRLDATAWIWSISTNPAFRRRGLATMVMRELMRLATEVSAYPRVHLYATAEGKKVYQLLGFMSVISRSGALLPRTGSTSNEMIYFKDPVHWELQSVLVKEGYVRIAIGDEWEPDVFHSEIINRPEVGDQPMFRLFNTWVPLADVGSLKIGDIV